MNANKRFDMVENAHHKELLYYFCDHFEIKDKVHSGK